MRHHWVCMLLFCFLVSGRLWGWCLESFWGVSVPLPPCSRARRSPSTPLGARGLVVAAHRVVMVTLRARLRCSRPHHLSRHLPQAHLLLMSLMVMHWNNEFLSVTAIMEWYTFSPLCYTSSCCVYYTFKLSFTV